MFMTKYETLDAAACPVPPTIKYLIKNYTRFNSFSYLSLNLDPSKAKGVYHYFFNFHLKFFCHWYPSEKASEFILNNLWSITPVFLVHRLRPLYMAWFIYMICFYVIPLSLGYGVMGILSLPLESEISLAVNDFLDLFR